MTELERAVRDKDSELEKLSSQLTERDNITEVSAGTLCVYTVSKASL